MSSASEHRPSARGRRRASTTPVNVTKDRTSFVGRNEDIRDLKAALERSRLVTLVGPGGIGKSRLARELGSRVVTLCPGGIWLIELAEVDSEKRVATVVARTLGISERSGRQLEVEIANVLPPNTLLILDNCEHVIDASARLAAALLAGNPSVRILATSREPLEIDGETTFAVAALPVPDTETDITPDEYTKSPAVELFVDRVRSRDRGFRVTDDNWPLIASVCASLGGMPLALELAAARASRVSLAALADQIEEQLGFESLRRDIPERHRSMRAALAESYTALAPEEQGLWKRVSVFAGSASLSAIHALHESGTREDGEVEAALESLIERSIVTCDSATSESRYRMLEPIRLFGLEQARLGHEDEALRRAHLEWCAGLIPPDAWITGSEQVRWMHTFQAEHSNIASALDYCLSKRESDPALELFVGTFLFWTLSGWYQEERHYAEALLRASTKPSRVRTIGLFAAGIGAWYAWEDAQPWFEQAEVAARRDVRGRGLARHGLGWCAIMSESYDRAITVLESACELLEESETTVYLGQARYALSKALALGRHDYAAARETAEVNLTLTAPDDIWNRGMTHAWLGLLDWRGGALDEAERHLIEAMGLQTTLGNRFGLAASLEYLAWVAASKDEPARAAQLLGHAESIFMRIGVNLVTGLIGYRNGSIQLVRQRLGAERYRSLRQTGARMHEDEIVRLARRDPVARDDESLQPLTARELEVVELIARGATNSQISFELLIAHETVKTHVRSILRKLGFDSRAQIAAWYGAREPGTSAPRRG